MGNICIGREVVICLYVYITVAEIRVRSPKNEHISEVGLGFGKWLAPEQFEGLCFISCEDLWTLRSKGHRY